MSAVFAKHNIMYVCVSYVRHSILSRWCYKVYFEQLSRFYIPARQANDITIQEALAASSNQSQHRLQQIV